MPKLKEPLSSRFWKRVDSNAGPDGCWIWNGATTGRGYGSLRSNGATLKSHRVAWSLSRGAIPTGLHVLHSCDNPPCCNPAHLFIGTHEDNMADRENKGRNAPTQGTSNGRAKLTDADVSKIFSHHASGQSYRKIGAIMGINYAHVGRILRRRAWRHLSLPPA